MNRHSSKSICVTRLLFCQNDFPMGDHSGNRTKHTLELFMPIMIFSPVANLMHNPLGTWRLLTISVTYLGEFWDISCFFSNFSEEMLNVEPITFVTGYLILLNFFQEKQLVMSTNPKHLVWITTHWKIAWKPHQLCHQVSNDFALII